DLQRATLSGADLSDSEIVGANLSGAILRRVDLQNANLANSQMQGCDLQRAMLVRTNFEGANLTGCAVYGIAAWNLKLDGAIQRDLLLTLAGEPPVTVDNLEVAQFIHLLVFNSKVRSLINAITGMVVLILGRFSADRRPVVDAIREALRER